MSNRTHGKMKAWMRDNVASTAKGYERSNPEHNLYFVSKASVRRTGGARSSEVKIPSNLLLNLFVKQGFPVAAAQNLNPEFTLLAKVPSHE